MRISPDSSHENFARIAPWMLFLNPQVGAWKTSPKKYDSQVSWDLFENSQLNVGIMKLLNGKIEFMFQATKQSYFWCLNHLKSFNRKNPTIHVPLSGPVLCQQRSQAALEPHNAKAGTVALIVAPKGFVWHPLVLQKVKWRITVKLANQPPQCAMASIAATFQRLSSKCT